jgi:hypothetical protein
MLDSLRIRLDTGLKEDLRSLVPVVRMRGGPAAATKLSSPCFEAGFFAAFLVTFFLAAFFFVVFFFPVAKVSISGS